MWSSDVICPLTFIITFSIILEGLVDSLEGLISCSRETGARIRVEGKQNSESEPSEPHQNQEHKSYRPLS